MQVETTCSEGFYGEECGVECDGDLIHVCSDKGERLCINGKG